MRHGSGRFVMTGGADLLACHSLVLLKWIFLSQLVYHFTGALHRWPKSPLRQPAADCRTAATTRSIAGVNGLVVMSFNENQGRALSR